MHSSTLLVLAGVAVVSYVAWDYVRNYLSECRNCKGTGIMRAHVWSRQFRPCPRCKRKREVSHRYGPKS